MMGLTNKKLSEIMTPDEFKAYQDYFAMNNIGRLKEEQ
jgi:hypothetical protein